MRPGPGKNGAGAAAAVIAAAAVVVVVVAIEVTAGGAEPRGEKLATSSLSAASRGRFWTGLNPQQVDSR